MIDEKLRFLGYRGGCDTPKSIILRIIRPLP